MLFFLSNNSDIMYIINYKFIAHSQYGIWQNFVNLDAEATQEDEVELVLFRYA